MLKRIVFYDDRRGDLPDLKELSGYLLKYLPHSRILIKNNAFPLSFARRFLSIKVTNVNKKIDAGQSLSGRNFFPAELTYEMERLKDPFKKTSGVIYDGFEFLKIFGDLIPDNEAGCDFLHITFTNRLLATFSEDDMRYHLRTGIYSVNKAAVSVTGIVEAPARPREYYVKKMTGASPPELKKEFGSRFIDYGDTRITDVARGLVMQAIFYHLTGEPFCDDKKCRLYNAHWQEDLIESQVKNKREFCPGHRKLLKEL